VRAGRAVGGEPVTLFTELRLTTVQTIEREITYNTLKQP
jgi:hypothetical protein